MIRKEWPMKNMQSDALAELEKRLDAYLQSSQEAEKIALKKLEALSEQEPPPSPVEILRRERLRHRTQTLLLKDIKGWIEELTAKEAN